MNTRTRAEAIRSFEAVTSDLMPTCPRCGDLSRAGAPFCQSCNGPLTEDAAYGHRLENLKPFYCANCCRHFADNACDLCGASLGQRGDVASKPDVGSSGRCRDTGAPQSSGRPSPFPPDAGGRENLTNDDRGRRPTLPGVAAARRRSEV